MKAARDRFDVIESLRNPSINKWLHDETAAFHGRKIVESIAYSALVAIEQHAGEVPRDLRGQWNAETILKSLIKRKVSALPIACNVSASEDPESSFSINAAPERNLSAQEIIAVYQRLHTWLHEDNPYRVKDVRVVDSRPLWADLDALRSFLRMHYIQIGDKSIHCNLWYPPENKVLVMVASAIA